MENEEYVRIELNFEGGEKEEIEIEKDMFLKIQMMALKENIPFEDMFVKLLEEEIKLNKEIESNED